MHKNNILNGWFWKWHFIAGILSLPFIILLSITGTFYLFKESFEENQYAHLQQVEAVGSQKMSLDDQQQIAQAYADEFSLGSLDSFYLPKNNATSTVFFSGRFGPDKAVYVDPYKQEVLGYTSQADTVMQRTRKLHGELWLGRYGTKVIELVASWLVVLILTGLYLWWPKDAGNWRALFKIRTNKGKRIFFRDLHGVLGFWASLVLFVILSGGLPWTDFFGKNLSKVQKLTDSGYPVYWWSNRGLSSEGSGLPLTLEEVAQTVESYELEGDVHIRMPTANNGVIAVVNAAPRLRDQESLQLNVYTGEPIVHYRWSDVGLIAAGRQVTMRLHQGEFFGFVNWLVILTTAIALFTMSIAILVAYIMRKPKGKLGVPNTPKQFNVGIGLIITIVLLGVVFPMFGFSVIFIVVWHCVMWLFTALKNKWIHD